MFWPAGSCGRELGRVATFGPAKLVRNSGGGFGEGVGKAGPGGKCQFFKRVGKHTYAGPLMTVMIFK
jgi:hypothetical protein